MMGILITLLFLDEYLEMLAKESARLRARQEATTAGDVSQGDDGYEDDDEDEDDDDDDDTIFVSRE